MSFHGGMLGVVIATIIFCRRNAIPMFGFGDRIAAVAPIGLCLGRLANFINSELWGRQAPEWLPWAMVFPNGGNILRHPSQLYQAGLEGLALGIVMWVLVARPAVLARHGMLTGVFLIGYGIARIIGEVFRQPDAFLGFLPGGLTMGQLLSIPMILAGIWFIGRAKPNG
jgi:phosphatidylglycerol:prolipoprotein diacylglycerol transferase